LRVITHLIDVAPVPVPAYCDSTVGLRSLAEYMQAPGGSLDCGFEWNEKCTLHFRPAVHLVITL
jgi:hypothetical protein